MLKKNFKSTLAVSLFSTALLVGLSQPVQADETIEPVTADNVDNNQPSSQPETPVETNVETSNSNVATVAADGTKLDSYGVPIVEDSWIIPNRSSVRPAFIYNDEEELDFPYATEEVFIKKGDFDVPLDKAGMPELVIVDNTYYVIKHTPESDTYTYDDEKSGEIKTAPYEGDRILVVRASKEDILKRRPMKGAGLRAIITKEYALPEKVKPATTIKTPLSATKDNSKDPQVNFKAADGNIYTDRIAGQNRFKNAVAISQAGWNQSEVVFLANGYQFADSLTGAPLAALYDAPILLTRADRIEEETIKEIARLKAREVVILGGLRSVNQEIQDQLAKSYVVTRIGGKNRYEQAALVAAEMAKATGKTQDQVFVASGESFADALSIAQVAAQKQIPILLTRGNRVENEFKAYVKPGLSYTIIGGEATISKKVAQEIAKHGKTYRIGGRDRYEVNRNILKQYGNPNNHTYVVSGEAFADALPASVLANKHKTSILLVRNHELTLQEQVLNALNNKTFNHFTLIGGHKTLTQHTEKLMHQPKLLAQYMGVKSSQKITNKDARGLVLNAVTLFSRPELTYHAREIGKIAAEAVVRPIAKAVRADDKTFYQVIYNKLTGWIPADQLRTERLLSHVPYRSQYKPFFAPYGCAGGAASMLLGSVGVNPDIKTLITNVPMEKDGVKGGQNGNNFVQGIGFNKVVEAPVLTKYLNDSYLKNVDHTVENISGYSTDQIIREVLKGNPIQYYGYTAYQFNPAHQNRRNHNKVIAGFKDGKFLVYDPAYNNMNGGPGSTSGNRYYDRGARAWTSRDYFEEEYYLGGKPGSALTIK
ncbi:hypothetical protein AWM75_00240 [Aerococcus urinaehominis]|uniref:Uncharacterized protein n=1 Tax=Aerococcus urinaehominis TaxID=128944 RepID=A0A109RG38_9LACT|nr:cell wall-binding repeat-containing protein [Aerococcus urinaehominis]AMB98513.1 hypothetical protein AWM75_00240 [Aerococcus urinaehominis]SDL80040.1 Putative cell wall-binding protein [Aerococcus urinaehominis]